jgi:hypothetical protein
MRVNQLPMHENHLPRPPVIDFSGENHLPEHENHFPGPPVIDFGG